MKEIWRAVVGYEDYYEVSNWGRVRSLPRMTARGVLGGQILKSRKQKNGYLTVNLCKDGKPKAFYIHRLVGMAFPDLVDWTEDAKDKLFEELTVNHLNEVKTDNHVENLEWCDRKYNNDYGTRTERIAKALAKCVIQKTKDGALIKIWPSASEVERQTGWRQGNISNCCLGRQKSAYGYCWSYSTVVPS